jgi:hypothetical protein
VLLHAPRDVNHRGDREPRREEQVEHRLGDAEVEAPDVDRDPLVELELSLNSFCGWKSSFLPALPKITPRRTATSR